MKLKQNWYQINWKLTYSYVSQIQRDLVVAYKNNDLENLYFLQNKLMMSFEGRAIAVRKITLNKGGKTPGIDGITWKSPSDKYLAISKLRVILVSKSNSYKSGPIRRVWISKSTPNELRPLGIPNMIDRALQALILLCLDPIVEETSDSYSFGFRKFRGAHDAIQRIRTILDKPRAPRWVWYVDIDKCFDEISHEFLEKEIQTLLNGRGNEFISKWLKAPIIEKGVMETPKKGTPQGNILSPLLCNITLNGLENAVRDGTPSPNSKEGRRLTGIWCVRYANDFIVTSPSKYRLVEEIIPRVKIFLSERGLRVSEKKSQIINLEKEGFDFLGWKIKLRKRDLKLNQSRNNKHVLIIRPQNKALIRVKNRLKEEFKIYNKPIETLIRDINPILKGWTNYYRSSYHSQLVFQSLGHYVYQKWWKWALKKHPNRNKNWIYYKYIFVTPERSWRIGKSKDFLLFDPTLAKQIKVKNLRNNINPYVDEDYYVQRTILRDADRFRKAIYKIHNFRCTVCNQPLFGEEQIHLHHIIARKDGGMYSLENIIPLHATCHDSITYAKINK